MIQGPIIFGTHKLSKKAVMCAIENGITFFDTATGYNNALVISESLKDVNSSRNSLIKINVITKFNQSDFEKDFKQVAQKHTTDLSPNVLIHTVLLHSPLKTNEESLKALTLLKNQFPGSRIGLSNFDIEKIKYLVSNGFIPDLVSIEFHPYYQPLRLLEFCKSHGIRVTGYRTLAKGLVFSDQKLKEIALKHNVGIMDVIVSWCHLNGVVPTISSSKEVNIKQLATYTKDFNLDQDDLRIIGSLDQGAKGSTCMVKYCCHDSNISNNL